LLNDENIRQVEAFLSRTPMFRRVAVDLPAGLTGPDLRLSPAVHGTDGFYAAVLERAA
jgi:16S rRNA (cytosine967-C5)-methyltransferase